MHKKNNLAAEWELQSAALITWPHQASDWAKDSNLLSAITKTYLQIASAISKYQQLYILCYDSQHLTKVKYLINNNLIPKYNITYLTITTNDTWIRDYGPISIKSNNKINYLDFQFNAWGNKYPATKDNLVNQKLYSLGILKKSKYQKISLTLEGGAIDSNGQGILMSTNNCLFSLARNPNYSPSEIKQLLQQHIGYSELICLKNSYLAGDDTDGHIDMLARFVNANTICYSTPFDQTDQNYQSLTALAAELKKLTKCINQTIKLVGLPAPRPKFNQQQQQLPASYANFVIINQAVLVPAYNDPADYIAQQILQQYFKQHKVILINSLTLIEQRGSLHCAIMTLAHDQN